MNRNVISVLFVSLLSACAGTPPAPESLQASPPSAVNGGTTAAPASVGAPLLQQGGLPPYKDPGNVLYHKRSVYFDFDRSLIRNEDRSVVDAHARYLGNNRTQKIRVEGNTDDQGSREYNLALGQKRAYAVKKAMMHLGAHEDQVEPISWGEERPRAAGHDESAWAENRRADIKYADDK